TLLSSKVVDLLKRELLPKTTALARNCSPGRFCGFVTSLEIEADEFPAPSSRTILAMIRFHDSWLEEPALRDWLVKVTNDESRAYCRWCAIVLRAHKADLTTHASTAKHAKNAESASLAGVNSGPMSVQIVPSDEQVIQGAIAGQTQRTGYSDLNYTYQRSPYSKRFRPEWQEIDELKAWLEPCQEDSTKAYCKMCAVQLRAHKHDLLLHGRSTKHKRCSQVASPAAVASTSANANVMPVEYETTVPHSEMVPGTIVDTIVSSVDDEPVLKKPRIVTEGVSPEDVIQTISTDDGETTTVIIPDDTRNGSQNELNGAVDEDRDMKPTQISIIRVVDKPKNSSIVYTQDNFRTATSGNVVRRRRGRMNAADVVRAVELNEFTGYEMLQILKSIVPKL
ncbi:unnamed protein product, partial [Allacma fusca]